MTFEVHCDVIANSWIMEHRVVIRQLLSFLICLHHAAD